MMHGVEKVVHVEIEELVKATGEDVGARAVAVRFVFVGQRLANNKNARVKNVTAAAAAAKTRLTS